MALHHRLPLPLLHLLHHDLTLTPAWEAVVRAAVRLCDHGQALELEVRPVPEEHHEIQAHVWHYKPALESEKEHHQVQAQVRQTPACRQGNENIWLT